MFDPDFNPYDRLEKITQDILQLANAINFRGELQTKMVEQLNRQTLAINDHESMIHELHNRIRLLEVARQYENKDHDNP